jgi:hypothetical protein
MKTNLLCLHGIALALVLVSGSARAQILAPPNDINALNSTAAIKFTDNTSLNAGNPGSIYSQVAGTWSGTTLSLSQTDSTTLDYANGDLAATGSGTSYSVSLNNIVLSQLPLNTGFADLNFLFTVEYQLGAGGLPSLTTLFPNFLVSGTVQTASTSYAAVRGTIDYYGVNSAGVVNWLDTVTYGWSYTTPGNFANQLVIGTPMNGTTPALGPNSTLTLVGNITFEVDPATITVETVPEPRTLALAGLGAASLFAFRRRQVAR